MRAAAKLQVRPRQVVAFLLASLAPGFLAIVTSLFGQSGEGADRLHLLADRAPGP
jgi:hypothetical protein